MRKKLYLITLAVALMALVAVPVWAAITGDVNVSITVNEVVAIAITNPNVSFTIDAGAIAGMPGTVPLTAVTTPTVSYFCNKDAAWHIEESATNFAGGTGLELALNKLRHSAAWTSGNADGTAKFAFAEKAVAVAANTLYTGSTKTKGWNISTLTYKLYFDGSESPGGPYTNIVTYTISAP